MAVLLPILNIHLNPNPTLTVGGARYQLTGCHLTTTPFTPRPCTLIPHPPSVGSRFAASGSTPSKSSTQPSTSPQYFAAHPPIGRKSFSFRRTEPGFRRPPRSGGLRKPGAGRGAQENYATATTSEEQPPASVASAALRRSPAAREISSRLKKFSSSASSSALLPYAMVRPPHPLLLDGNMRDANIVSGRAGPISERPCRKRERPSPQLCLQDSTKRF